MTTECIDLTGTRFGRWAVLGKHSKKSQWLWLCRCDCGTEKAVFGCALRRGESLSCGCLAKELLIKRSETHGMTDTLEFFVWRGMIDRCYKKTTSSYKNYGGRGIRMCDEWRNSFEAFYRDMGPKPPDMSLDRIDNDGNYEPSNCRWATRSQQGRNRRTTKRLLFRGELHSLADIAEISGINYSTFVSRLAKGMTLERAVTKGKL